MLTVTKTISGTGSGPFPLEIAGPNGFAATPQIDDGQTITLSLPGQGIYTVTETTPVGWSTIYTATPGTGGTSQAVVSLVSANTATLAATPISGTVFRDFNSDGLITDDGTITDSGLGGVTVTAYDKTGATVGSATTASDGTYTINPTGDGPYRVEFSDLPAGYELTSHGTDNGTSTQFVTTAVDASDVNLGVGDPCDFCQDDPLLVVPVFRNGDPLGSGTSGTRDNSYALSFDASGTSPGATSISTHADTGAIWGQAYHRDGEQLLRSAVVRRHEGLGTGGLGAIYRTDLTGSPSTSLLVDLEALGVDFGTISDNTTRGLPAAANGVNVDASAFPLVGKAGIGGIDLSATGDTLYVMNLFDRKLYQAPLPDATVAPTSLSEVGTMPWLASDPCTNGVARPWAVKQYREKIYVGVICTAESESTAASTAQPAYSTLTAHVYAYDTVGDSWASALTVPLDYTKGQTSSARHGSLDFYWLAWVDTFVRDTDSGADVSAGATFMMHSGRTSRPQPILSDLAFDTDGNMILGFMDRGGLQIGWSNRAPDYVSGTELLQYNISGDILRACGDPTAGWTLESGGACGGVTGGGANGEGPGGGEFYDGDVFGTLHYETMNGALTTLPGSDLVASAAMDPFAIDSGGVYWLSNLDGSKVRGAQLYAESGSFTGSTTVTNGSFGKSGAMGDVAILCDPPPLEIGNRVWDDLNGDGVQDPGEPGLANLTVTLTGPSGAVTTDTDSNGNYYFGNLLPNTAYTLTMVTPSGYGLTTANADALPGGDVSSNHPISDTRDSDALLLGGLPTINYTTGEAGQNNHGLDFGFTQPLAAQVDILNIAPDITPPSLALSKVLNSADTVRRGEFISYTVTITNTGATTITVLPLEDVYNPTYLTFVGGTPHADDNVSDGMTNWSDLTAAPPLGFGTDLAPGAAFQIETRFLGRNDTSLTGPAVNTARVRTAEDENGGTPPEVSDNASVDVLAPTAVYVSDASALQHRQMLTFRWRTSDESAIVAFRILRTAATGDETVLTPDAILATYAGQPLGTMYTYTMTAPDDLSGLFILETIAPDGSVGRHDMGPATTAHTSYLPHLTR